MQKSLYRFGIIFILLLSIFNMNLSGFRVSGETGDAILTIDSETKIASSGNLELYLTSNSGNFYVLDKASAVKYESNPQNWEQDFVAQAVWRTALNSNLVVNYASGDGTIFGSIDSYSGSAKLSESKIQNINDGFRITYNFPKQGFSIPLEIALVDGKMQAKVIMKDVKVTNKFVITNISVLPFFGSANATDKGYMFVPSGCGGLINLNNGRTYATAFSDKIYGTDTSLLPESYSVKAEEVRLPVFGMRKNNNGFLGIITKGESLGVINASVSGYYTDNNHINAAFDIASSESYSIKDSIGKVRQFTVYDKLPLTDSDLEITYDFLNTTNATYAGMALKYREYLMSQKGVKEKTINRNLLLDIYGAVVKKQSFLGFPMNKTVPLTTYEKTQEIVDSVKNSADDKVTVSLEMATKRIINSKIADKIEPIAVLGGNREFQKLNESMGDNLYVAADPVSYKSKYFSFSPYNKAARTIMGLNALLKYYELETDQVNIKNSRTLISPLTGAKALSRIFVSSNKEEINLSLSSIGQYLYSDFGKDKINRIQSQKIWEDSFTAGKPAANRNLMVSKGNSYLLPFISAIKDAPIDSGNSLLINDSVPFMQIALSGLVDLYISPINLSANANRSFLKSIEYGMGIHYSLIGANSSILKDTDLKWLYGADFEMWKENIKDTNNKYKDAVKILENSKLTDHVLVEGGLSESYYENGIKLIFNYTDKAVLYKNQTIPAEGYLIIEVAK